MYVIYVIILHNLHTESNEAIRIFQVGKANINLVLKSIYTGSIDRFSTLTSFQSSVPAGEIFLLANLIEILLESYEHQTIKLSFTVCHLYSRKNGNAQIYVMPSNQRYLITAPQSNFGRINIWSLSVNLEHAK